MVERWKDSIVYDLSTIVGKSPKQTMQSRVARTVLVKSLTKESIELFSKDWKVHDGSQFY